MTPDKSQFHSLSDAVQRLLSYHVCQGAMPTEEDLKKGKCLYLASPSMEPPPSVSQCLWKLGTDSSGGRADMSGGRATPCQYLSPEALGQMHYEAVCLGQIVAAAAQWLRHRKSIY